MSVENKGSKLIVIGAGLAGLTVAYRLMQNGIDVEIYEARKRVGGRVLSVHLCDHIAELGGQNISDGKKSENIRRLINEMNLELDQRKASVNHSYFDKNTLISVKQLLNGVPLSLNEIKAILENSAEKFHNMKDVLDEIFEEGHPLYKIFSVRLSALEGGPIEKLSTYYIETLMHLLSEAYASTDLEVTEGSHEIHRLCIKGGNSLLPMKIAEKLGARLHLNMPLQHLSKDAKGAYALKFKEGQIIKADRLILALPCSIYHDLVFEDAVIHQERLEAIKSVRYGTNAKVMVPFAKPPSTKSRLINDQIMSCFDIDRSYLTLHYTAESGLFCRDRVAHAYKQSRAMIEKGFKDSCPSYNAPVYAEDRPFFKYDRPIGYSWQNDPYAKGSYAYISPGQEALMTATNNEGEEIVKTLFSPISNTLYFTGEHTSILTDVAGTMEAAVESAERTARLILKQS